MKLAFEKEPSWFSKRRKEALDSFEILPLPYFKYGRNLLTKLDDLNLVNKPSSNKIKFTNSNDVLVLNVNEALQTEHAELIKKYFMTKVFYPNENKISSFHAAFCDDALLIYIPENVNVKEPVEINLNNISISHILVVACPNSKVKITELDKSDLDIKSHAVEIFAMENSNVTYESFQNFNENTWNFTIRRALAGNNSNVNWFTGNLGGKLNKIEVSTDLIGQGSSTKNYGIFLGRNNEHFDIYNSSIHTSSNSSSDIANKAILTNKARSIYRGLIDIKEQAKNCDGYQKQDTLMLSKDCEANTVPNLEINNNDVKCSHGATVSQLDKDKIFYLMTRGLTKVEAEQQIVNGFLIAMLDKISSNKLKEELQEKILERLS